MPSRSFNFTFFVSSSFAVSISENSTEYLSILPLLLFVSEPPHVSLSEEKLVLKAKSPQTLSCHCTKYYSLDVQVCMVLDVYSLLYVIPLLPLNNLTIHKISGNLSYWLFDNVTKLEWIIQVEMGKHNPARLWPAGIEFKWRGYLYTTLIPKKVATLCKRKWKQDVIISILTYKPHCSCICLLIYCKTWDACSASQ